MHRSIRSSSTTSSAIASRSVDRHELHRLGRQPGARRGRPAPRASERAVALERLATAAQDARVAGLEAQRRGVGRDVRPRLVDHRDHAERDAHARDLEPVRAGSRALDPADQLGCRRRSRATARARPATRASSSRSRSSIAARGRAALAGGEIARVRREDVRARGRAIASAIATSARPCAARGAPSPRSSPPRAPLRRPRRIGSAARAGSVERSITGSRGHRGGSLRRCSCIRAWPR